MHECDNLTNYSTFKRGVIEKYLKVQEPYTHDEKQELVMDFIDKYAWLVRLIYCHHICPHRSDCLVAKTDHNLTKPPKASR
jgi:hypothetical protein